MTNRQTIECEAGAWYSEGKSKYKTLFLFMCGNKLLRCKLPWKQVSKNVKNYLRKWK